MTSASSPTRRGARYRKARRCYSRRRLVGGSLSRSYSSSCCRLYCYSIVKFALESLAEAIREAPTTRSVKAQCGVSCTTNRDVLPRLNAHFLPPKTAGNEILLSPCPPPPSSLNSLCSLISSSYSSPPSSRLLHRVDCHTWSACKSRSRRSTSEVRPSHGCLSWKRAPAECGNREGAEEEVEMLREGIRKLRKAAETSWSTASVLELGRTRCS